MVKKMSERNSAKNIEQLKPRVVREADQEKRGDITYADHIANIYISATNYVVMG